MNAHPGQEVEPRHIPNAPSLFPLDHTPFPPGSIFVQYCLISLQFYPAYAF